MTTRDIVTSKPTNEAEPTSLDKLSTHFW